MVVLFNLLAATTLACGVAGWLLWIRAASTRRLWLPAAEAHAPCRWGLFDLLLLAALWLFGAMCAGSLIPQPEPSPSTPVEATSRAHDQHLQREPLERLSTKEKTHFFWATGCASLAVTLTAAGLIAARTNSRWDELGFRCDRLGYDMLTGAIAFAMTAPLVLAVQGVLVTFWPSKHPLIEALKADWNEALYAAVCWAAVVGAPVFEEFAFRVLLYGWLRNWAVAQPTGHELLFGDFRAASGRYEGSETRALFGPRGSVFGRMAAMLLSALAFGLMHWNHGPDWVPLTLLGLVLAWLYERTGRIGPCIVVHLLLNGFTMLGLRVTVLHS